VNGPPSEVPPHGQGAGWRECALAVTASLLTLYAVEVAITPRLGTERVRHDGMLTKLHVITALRARGVEAFPAVYPFLFRGPNEVKLDGRAFIPLGGVADVTTVLCNEADQIVVYRSDERGFNNPRGLWTSPADALLVGDSFTHGECVTTEETIGGLLRRQWPRTISLGMGGNGPLTELAGVAEFSPVLEPHTIVWLYYEGNDLLDLRHELADPILRRYLEPGFRQGLEALAPQVDRALRAYVAAQAAPPPPRLDSAMSVLKLRNLRRLFRAASVRMTGSDRSPTRETAALGPPASPSEEEYATLERILQLAQRHVVGPQRLVFVYLPAWERYGRPGGADIVRRRVLEVVRRLSVGCVDVHPDFLQHPNPMSLFMMTQGTPGHYTPEGYRIVATAIRRELERNP